MMLLTDAAADAAAPRALRYVTMRRYGTLITFTRLFTPLLRAAMSRLLMLMMRILTLLLRHADA